MSGWAQRQAEESEFRQEYLGRIESEYPKLKAEIARKDNLISDREDLARINGELYAHTELCIRKAAFSIKVTREDDDRHNELLAQRETVNAKLAALREED